MHQEVQDLVTKTQNQLMLPCNFGLHR